MRLRSESLTGPRGSARNRRSDQSLRRDGGGAAERFKPKRYVRARGAARPHPEADGVRRECPEFAAPPRMTGLSAPRLGEARALLGTARPRRCLTAAAVRGWAGTSRCRGTPATAGAAGGAGRTRSHDPARPWVRQCARRLLQWGQSLTVRPARGARRAPWPRPARPGRRRPRRTPHGRTTRRRAAPTRPAGPATDPGCLAGRSPSSAGHPRPARDRPRTTPTARPASGRPAWTSSRRPPLQHASYRTPVRTKLGLTAPAQVHLRGLVGRLDAAWAQMTDRLAGAGDSASVRVVPDAGGRTRLSVERLDALEIPESLVELRDLTAAMLPRVDLPELAGYRVCGTSVWKPGCRCIRGSSTGCCCRVIWMSVPGWRSAAVACPAATGCRVRGWRTAIGAS